VPTLLKKNQRARVSSNVELQTTWWRAHVGHLGKEGTRNGGTRREVSSTAEGGGLGGRLRNVKVVLKRGVKSATVGNESRSE